MKNQHFLLGVFLIVGLLIPACAPKAADCTSEEVFCVGLVSGAGKITDKSFTQSAWEGVLRAEKELGARVQYIESADVKEPKKNIAQLGDAGYDVIVTVGSELGEATIAAARTYPEIDFIGVDQFQAETLDGVVGLIFPEDQAGFLVGALAASVSKSHRIGAVCASNVSPAVWRFGEGYRAGAAYMDQLNAATTDVLVVYNIAPNLEETVTDPEWGAATAMSMMDQGADTIFGCGGTTGDGAITAAAQAGVYAIGVDSDQYLTLPEAAPRLLTSAMKLISPGVFELIGLSKDSAFPGGNYMGDVTNAPFHDLENEVPDEVKAILEEIRAGLLSGLIRTDVPPVSN